MTLCPSQNVETVQCNKNAVLNSFIETQKLTLSEDKSVLLHVVKTSNVNSHVPFSRRTKNNMKNVQSVKYLGDIISVQGGAKANIENRRNKGWGKVAKIVGILYELPSIQILYEQKG